jgi:phage FluMu protein Com
MSLELLNYKHSSFLLLGVKLPKQRIINNIIKKSMDQIPATYSTIENSFKEKNIINFKSNVKDNSRKIFYIYKYFQPLFTNMGWDKDLFPRFSILKIKENSIKNI